MPVIERFGKWLSLNPPLVEKTRHYYDKYGDRLLLVAFFIPGLRQFIGYFIGIIRVPYRKVATYAYAGTCFWVLAFFTLGYGFGEQWQHVFAAVERNLKMLLIGAGCIWAGLLFKKWTARRSNQRSIMNRLVKKAEEHDA
jgi:membrane protein DedA with SNARE-associated domain